VIDSREPETTMENKPRTALNVEAVRRMLVHEFTSDVLKQIPLLSPGTTLEASGIYLNLKDPQRKAFLGDDKMKVVATEWIIRKSSVTSQVWNRLIGIFDMALIRGG